MAFLDVSNTHDTIWREGLWEKMNMYGIEKKFIRVCQRLYQDVEPSIVLDGQQSRWFKVEYDSIVAAHYEAGLPLVTTVI